MSAQYGAPLGLTTSLDMPADCNGVLCAPITGEVLGWVGTQTVKQPMVEVLSVLICHGEPVWTGEQFQGTLSITSPPAISPGLTGPCWFIYEVANYGSQAAVAGAFEINLIIFYK